MPGHGESYFLNKEAGFPKGYFGGKKNSWQMLLADEMGFHEYAVEKFGREGLGYILYGHSMGSFVVRNIFFDTKIQQAVRRICLRTDSRSEPGSRSMQIPCRAGMLFRREKKRNNFINIIAFAVTQRESRTPEAVSIAFHSLKKSAKYAKDPMCGFLCFTNDGFRTLLI